MTDLAVIILICNERLHIRRCLERLAPLEPREIFMIDSGSTDDSPELAKRTAEDLSLNARCVSHPWPGTHAKQLTWALNELPLASKWILRLDADEYLTDETIVRLRNALADNSLTGIDGCTLELRRRFMGGEIRHATSGIRLVRLFRRGKGGFEDRAMDEHIRVVGKIIDFDGAFFDDNLNTFAWWQAKHRGYAKREAQDALSLFSDRNRLVNPSANDRRKIAYYRLPRYARAILYFGVRYVLKGGFLDGVAGWRWNFWQGLWYRWLVDREIGKLQMSRRAECRTPVMA